MTTKLDYGIFDCDTHCYETRDAFTRYLPKEFQDRAIAPVRAADCEVANTNLSQWMVEQGWARPTADAPKIYAELNKAAVDAGRGLYQADGR